MLKLNALLSIKRNRYKIMTLNLSNVDEEPILKTIWWGGYGCIVFLIL